MKKIIIVKPMIAKRINATKAIINEKNLAIDNWLLRFSNVLISILFCVIMLE